MQNYLRVAIGLELPATSQHAATQHARMRCGLPAQYATSRRLGIKTVIDIENKTHAAGQGKADTSRKPSLAQLYFTENPAMERPQWNTSPRQAGDSARQRVVADRCEPAVLGKCDTGITVASEPCRTSGWATRSRRATREPNGDRERW